MKDMNKARAVYDIVCAALDKMKWVYDKEEEELAITTGAKGTDLPIDIIIRVLPEAEVLSVQVPFAFDVPDEHSIDVAIAIAAANYGLIRGCFDYDMTTGDIRFRVSAPYNGNTTLAAEVVEMLVLIAATTVDSYQSRLLMVAKGIVTPSKFLAEENPEDEADTEEAGEDSAEVEQIEAEASNDAEAKAEAEVTEEPTADSAEEAVEK